MKEVWVLTYVWRGLLETLEVFNIDNHDQAVKRAKKITNNFVGWDVTEKDIENKDGFSVSTPCNDSDMELSVQDIR